MKIAIDNFEKHPSVSWYFFYNFSNENRASKNLNVSLTTIHRCLKSWKDAGFLHSKKEVIKRKGKKDRKGKQTYNGYETETYCLNLEPLIVYCKEKRNIEFNPEERLFLEKCFSSYIVRERLFRFFKEENFFDGLLKYYVYDMMVYYNQSLVWNDNLEKVKFDQMEKFLRIKNIKDVPSQFFKDKKMIQDEKKAWDEGRGYQDPNWNYDKFLKQQTRTKLYIKNNQKKLKKELFQLNDKIIKAFFTGMTNL